MTVDAKAMQSILIIDDSASDCDMFERLLRQGFVIDQVTRAETGKEGIQRYKEAKPDCVLLDYSLPSQDGVETLKSIKGIDRHASVIMLTGQGSEAVAVAAMKAGASDYLIKDKISAVDLRRAINDAIKKTMLERKIDSQQEEQGLFIRTLLHDSRAPLRHISTFSQLLNADAEAGDYSSMAAYCGDIRFAVKRIEDLLNTLESYALSEANVDFETVCMNDVIKQVLDNLAHRIKSRQAVVRHDPLPNVIGHAPQLIQLLQNLIGNSIKFCEADQPVIEITVAASEENGKQLFRVQDNGIGIPNDKLAYVFHPFKRLWSHDAYEGTGLGLAICQKIVKRHGGRIWCEPQAGQGSVFFFVLNGADFAEDSQKLAS